MNLRTICVISIYFILLTHTEDLACLTGHQILVRKTQVKNDTRKYKLMTKCLCPNNYQGKECSQHVSIDCYLNPLKSLGHVNSSNINESMAFQLEFDLNCWVTKKNKLSQKIELREYLSKFNESNVFGVREQFGPEYEIVWANTTQIFDSEGELKTLKQMQEKNDSYQMRDEEKLKILIGNNSKLYKTPFQYQESFLGFGLINGNIQYQLAIIHPEKGTISQNQYSQTDIEVSGLSQYLNSFYVENQIENITNTLLKNITEQINTNGINQTLQKYINDPQKLKIIDLSAAQKLNQPQTLPHIKLPIKINPYLSTFYQAIRLQLGIKENFQQVLTHQVSLNSILWAIPVNVENLGLPEPTKKHLTITDQANKSNYKILVVVIFVILVYFGLSYGHKRYKKWKNKQYTEFDDEGDNFSNKNYRKKMIRTQAAIKQAHNQSVRSHTSASTTQQYQLKERNEE